MNWLELKAVSLFAPIFLGFAAKKGVDLLETFSTWLLNADPRVKVMVSGVVVLAVTVLAKFAAAALPPACVGSSVVASACLSALTDPSTLQVLLTWVFAHVWNDASNKAQS